MEGARLVEVRPGDRPGRWDLTLAPQHLTVSGAVQGGVALAAALDALEAATGRPLVLASAQFARHAGPEGVISLDVDIVVDGPRTTQARVRAHVADEEVLTVQGALGRRPLDVEGTWTPLPDVGAPTEGRPVAVPSNGADLGARLDVRLAVGRAPDELDSTAGPGRWAAWCRRLDTGPTVRPAELAVLADLSVLSLSTAAGRRLTGNSIDNTVRVVGDELTDWILLDVSVDAIHAGYAHVHSQLWSEGGALLATATQSLIVREPDGAGRAKRSNRRIVGAPPA